MRPYTTLQPTRTVMRTHVFDIHPTGFGPVPNRPILGITSPNIEVPGLDLWIMIGPSGLVWTWDGWMWC